jgi:uncharacterized protein involved in response to NO
MTQILNTILKQGFRPFFLGAAAWVSLSLCLWMLSVTGFVTLSVPDPLHWHAHEMLFGYTGAVITGFILTAIPNWTRRLPVSGLPLAVLVLLWMAGRLVVLMQGQLDIIVVIVVDASFLVGVFLTVLREIIAGKSWKNLPVTVVLGLYAAASVVDHLASTGVLEDGNLGQRMGLAVIIMLIGLIGGRVIPSFTGNWLAKQGATELPAPFSGYDKFSLLVLLSALVAWVVAPELAASGWLVFAAGIIHGFRMVRWRGYATSSDILVVILHVGYGWVVLGLILIGLDIVFPGTIPLSGIHAMTAGGIGTMTVAMMTRASLGHTGQGLVVGPGTVAIYGFITAGAVLRVLAPAFPQEAFTSILGTSAIFWGAGFALFVVVYFPLLAGLKPLRAW